MNITINEVIDCLFRIESKLDILLGESEKLNKTDIAKAYGISLETLRKEPWLLPRFGKKVEGESRYYCTTAELRKHREMSKLEMKEAYRNIEIFKEEK